MAALPPNFNVQFFTNEGAPAAGYLLRTYESGTTTNKASFTTQAGDVANTNPIELDADGRCSLWLGTGEYTLRLETPLGALVKTWDDVAGIPEGGSDAFVPIAGDVTMTGRFNLAGPALSGLQPVTLTQLNEAITGGTGSFVTTSTFDAHTSAANPHSGSASAATLTSHIDAANPHTGSASTTDLTAHTGAANPHSGSASTAALTAHVDASNPHSGSASTSALTALEGTVTALATSTGEDITALEAAALALKGVPANTTAGGVDGEATNVSAGFSVDFSAWPAGRVRAWQNTTDTAVTLTVTGGTLRLNGTTSTGNRSILPYGLATVRAYATGVAVISGGVS